MVLVNTQRLARYDFGHDIAFKLYNEDLTQFDATGWTGNLKSYKRHGDRAFFFRDVERALSVVGILAQVIPNIAVSWTTQNIGEGTFAYTETARPTLPAYYWVEVTLTKSGAQLSSDLVRIYVQPSEVG